MHKYKYILVFLVILLLFPNKIERTAMFPGSHYKNTFMESPIVNLNNISNEMMINESRNLIVNTIKINVL